MRVGFVIRVILNCKAEFTYLPGSQHTATPTDPTTTLGTGIGITHPRKFHGRFLFRLAGNLICVWPYRAISWIDMLGVKPTIQHVFIANGHYAHTWYATHLMIRNFCGDLKHLVERCIVFLDRATVCSTSLDEQILEGEMCGHLHVKQDVVRSPCDLYGATIERKKIVRADMMLGSHGDDECVRQRDCVIGNWLRIVGIPVGFEVSQIRQFPKCIRDIGNGRQRVFLEWFDHFHPDQSSNRLCIVVLQRCCSTHRIKDCRQQPLSLSFRNSTVSLSQEYWTVRFCCNWSWRTGHASVTMEG